jgi:hypothetical protein
LAKFSPEDERGQHSYPLNIPIAASKPSRQ